MLVGSGGCLEPCDSNTKLSYLISEVRLFLEERDWEKFHNPKDLAESICIEAAELLQLFQWMNTEKVSDLKNDVPRIEKLKEELADVMIYCLSMANSLQIDLTGCILSKLESNRRKYPAELFHGKTHV